MNSAISDSQLDEMIKSAVNSFGPLPPDERLSLLVSALRELQGHRKAVEPVGGDELDQLIWGLERYGLYPRQLAALKELREVRKANAEKLNQPVSETERAHPNSFTNNELEMMAHGDNPQANAYRELLAFRRNSPEIPDGYVMVPMRLTAENGAKGALSAEFSETKFINCPECFGDDECETCDGSGRIEITVPVTWTTIKAIWSKGVEHFATAAPKEVG